MSVENINFDKNPNSAQIEQMKRDLPNMLEYMVVLGKLKKALFDSLIKEGFDEKQAIEIVKGAII